MSGWNGTRREFGQITLGGLAATMAGTKLLAIDSTIGGVKVGAISYCFRSIPRPANGDYMDTMIDAFKQVGLGICELESSRVEPEPGIAGGGRMPATITPEYTKRRDEIRQWRMTVPMDRFKEIKSKFDKMTSAVFVDFQSMTVEEVTKLRDGLRAKGVEYKVVKNKLVRYALGGAPWLKALEPTLRGMTGVAWSYEEPSAAAKVLKEFIRENEKLKIKAGVLEGQVLDAKGVENQLAALPGKNEARAMLLATLMAPAQRMVTLLNAPAGNFVRLLKAKEQKG